MSVEIKKIKGDWQEIVDDCRLTVGLDSLGHDPTQEFKVGMMIAEHSPIRDISVKFEDKMPYWVAMHFKTHIWESRSVTQRNDRQKNYDRNEAPQGAPVVLSGECNLQHLIDTSRKRLCYCASPETRAVWLNLREEIKKVMPEVAFAMVPNCVYRCGCPEPRMCKEMFFPKFLKEFDAEEPSHSICSIKSRYKVYDRLLDGQKEENAAD